MKSEIMWVDDDETIALLKAEGMWNPKELLNVQTEALSLEPRYLIWDPTDLIFPPSHRKPIFESSPERQALASMMADALHEGRLRLYIVIQKNKSGSFETMRHISRSFDMQEKVRFVPSLDLAMTIIAEHQAEKRS